MKVKNAIKKVGAVAASTLMVGMTLGTAASLADFPSQYVDEEGAPTSNIVVGSQGQVTDVVGAINIAAALGQETIQTETRTEEMEVEVDAPAQWSAENGITLNRPNRNLYLDQNTASGIDELAEGDLNILQTQSFEDGGENNIDVEHVLSIEERNQAFGTKSGMEETSLYIDLARNDDLFSFEAFFSDDVNFTDEDFEGEEVTMFGRTFEVSEDTDDEVIALYGDSETFSVEDEESVDIEIGGVEYTFTVRHVSDGGTSTTFLVDGEPYNVAEGDSINLDGNQIRVRDIYPFGDGDGIVRFGVGSEKMELENGEPVVIAGDEVDATEVAIDSEDEDNSDVSSISISFFEKGRETRFIEAGGSYEDPIFGLEFHYGGAHVDAAEDPAETLTVEADGDEAVLTMTDDSGDTEDIVFVSKDDGEDIILGNYKDIGGHIMTYEGQNMTEEDYIILNEDENALMFEITELYFEGDEGEATIENVFTGRERVIEFDDKREEDVRINRIPYTFNIEGEGEGDEIGLQVTWEDEVVVYPNLYSETDSAVAFVSDETIEIEHGGDDVDIRLPSTKSSGDTVLTVDSDGSTDDEYDEDLFTIGEDEQGNITVEAEVDGPSLLVMQPEDRMDEEKAFTVEFSDEGDVEFEDVERVANAGFGFADVAGEDDLEASYSHYGTYFELDTDDEGELDINFPAHESVVGMAMTEDGGSLSATAVGDQLIEYEVTDLINPGIRGNLPNLGLTDDEVTEGTREANDLILVGGPAVNTLVEELADEGLTRTLDEWREEGEDEAILQVIEDAFAEGRKALIVAGHSAQDTTAAARYLSNYPAYQEELDTDLLELDSAEYPGQ